ncbi:phage gp16-like protein [Duganella sp. SG902]|uniref:gp16 family protein n=1 Tax=Duganella sp. SG902 TaxID=2587016 RepID=UPI00159D9D0E|nr:regulatory protein GemA [Duganella sp. SG902]NVM78881.1 phage gp16-like protein [Duganella sp. SG902]
MQKVNTELTRKSELAMIHVAKKFLSLEDDVYRSVLLKITGRDSSAQLDAAGRKALIAHFKSLGFKVVAKRADRGRPAGAGNRADYIEKIEAQLAEAKRPWSYADSMAKRICKIDRIEFCEPEHLAKVIAALSYDAKRHGRRER